MRDAAQFFKVLADEARLKILWLLFNHRELCVCDIMAALDITQSKASRHLGTLRHAGLVSDRKDGLWSYSALRPVDDELAGFAGVKPEPQGAGIGLPVASGCCCGPDPKKLSSCC